MVFAVDPDEFEDWCTRRGGEFLTADENEISPDGEELVCSPVGGGEVRISSDGSVSGVAGYDHRGNQYGEEGEPVVRAYWWKDGKIDALGGSRWTQDPLFKEGSNIRTGEITHREREDHRGDHRVYEDHLKIYGRDDKNIGFVISGPDEAFYMEE